MTLKKQVGLYYVGVNMNDKQNYTFSFSYDAEALRQAILMNNLIGRKLNHPKVEPEQFLDITDFTEANEVISRIKSKL